MRSHRVVGTGLLIVAALLHSAPAAADDDNPFGRGTSDRFAISFGGFLMNFNTTARVDSDRLPGSGTDFDLENDTNLSSQKNDLRLDGYWRFGRKHRLEFGALSVRRDSARVLDRTVEFGDIAFDVNATLNTEFNMALFKLAYKYSFIRGPRADFGFSAGLSTYKVKASMAGTGSIDGGPSGQAAKETEDVVAPVPVVGLHTDVRIGGNWYFKASGEYFHITVGDITGSLSDLRTTFDWYPFKHFGFGAGFNRVRLKYDDIGSTTIDFTYTYSGAMVYGTYVY